MYYIDRDEWDLIQLSFDKVFEFNYYSSAVTLPDGSILITGGGISSTVCQISFSAHSHHPRIIEREPMKEIRKEHATVCIQNSVYVLGGYNGVSNTFLSSCERFDLETNSWTPISSMTVPKCAFAVTNLMNQAIFTVGGYDGFVRLRAIEKYDIKLDKWTILDVEMRAATLK